MSDEFYKIKVKRGAEEVPMEQFKDKVLLIVNTASECGFTPQYKGLQETYDRWKGKGLEILAFPCNQFGQQEPGTDAEIKLFCERTFSTTFPIFSKLEVNGPNTDPLYLHLKKQAPGIFGSLDIKWNFTKFLIDKNGNVVKRYAPITKPEDIEKDIEKLVKA
ncbi:glutathione peroxidase [Leptospira sp. 2 VSF19]|uniref:Glutathione peroxidase n=1 Tax=Leptospira soteropolitanensis TaxID=2950025 RepID=A0AAW5VKS5_9LEPT|nr:glutathione peroxidase [Leptospira soteropolitanensis]MCW7494231.1 glutathione peroxidase [Leptospira soteropolitanensis]MCW7501794.1 glutathione peroxidase [Leptospira soteropolitanensis]MCW7524077.1 glutathione peroxidase [Leptospira soteropolitanensis]MCW7527942.1 glutathione peroxidase [Leptospira soteropolitanensis]MCW7531764.1 glutathione peroxidase [Leptospira soteropolitanensis]